MPSRYERKPAAPTRKMTPAPSGSVFDNPRAKDTSGAKGTKPKSATPPSKSGTSPRPTAPPGSRYNPGVDADGNDISRRDDSKVPKQPLPPITDRRGGATPGQPINTGGGRGRGRG